MEMAMRRKSQSTWFPVMKLEHWKLYLVVIVIFLSPPILFFSVFAAKSPCPTQLLEIFVLILISPLLALALLIIYPIHIGLFYAISYGLLYYFYRREKKSDQVVRLRFSSDA